MNKFRPWRVLAAMLASLVLAACGGGQVDTSDKTPTSDAVRKQALATPTVAAFGANGWYWNPSESGTGFMFEAQGSRGFVGFFMYEEGTGKPVWYVSEGAQGSFVANDDGSYTYAGELRSFSNGQPAWSTTYAPPTWRTIGNVRLTFTGNNAVASLPSRVMSATRFDFAGLGSTPNARQPETGWYWNPAEGGRGYAIEVQNNRLFMAMFHYNQDGSPAWNIVEADIPDGVATGNFVLYANGQTLTSTHRGGSRYDIGSFSLSFRNPCAGQIQLAGAAAVSIRRFVFGDLPGGAECHALSAATSDLVPGVQAGPVQLQPGDAVHGRIDNAADVDAYGIALKAGTSYEFNLKGAYSASGTLGDPVLALYDPSLAKLAENNDIGIAQNDARVTFIPSVTGTYYLAARSNDGGTGSFVLTSTGVAADLNSQAVLPVDAFAGTLTATLTGRESGTATLAIDSAGRVSGSVKLATGTTLTITGSLTRGGVLSFNSNGIGGSYIFSGILGPEAKLAGTWSGPSGPGGLLVGQSTMTPVVTKVASVVDTSNTSAADDPSAPPALDTVIDSRQIAGAETPADQASDTAPSTPAEPLPITSPSPATASGTASSGDIFVATNGNDAWSGSLAAPNAAATDGPKRTIGAAQTLARLRIAAMVAGSPRVPVTVRIASGVYRLSAPLTFGPADSGTAGAPVVYRAEVPGTVTLSGAIPIATMVGATAGNLMSMAAPPLPASAMRGGSQLFVNGKRATLARSPNEGNYWFVQKQVPLASEPAGATGQEAFVPPAEALTLINGLGTADRSQAMLKVFQAWSTGRHRLSTFPAPAGAVRVTPRTLWPFLSLGPNQRFFVENVAAALDAPGEWLWDVNGMRYIATAADAGKTLNFEMPALEQLVIIKGNAATGAWVQDLELRGLKFADTRLLTPDAGFVDNQAGVTIGAAIEVDAARRVVIDNCSIDRTGGYGVWLRTAVRDSQVTNCSMRDLGAGGVKVGLTAQLPTDINGTGSNQVRNNTIDGTGKQVPGAVGVWIGQSSDNTVANNLISNTSYTAISVGWNWKYGTATAMRNRITANLLLNIGTGQLSDLGGIYTLGESTGTLISGNIIHEVRPYPGYGAGAWGLYNDEASTGITWERNIVVGTDAGGYLLHYGRNNTVRNNLLAHGDRSEVRVTRSDPTLTKLDFKNNLLIPKNQWPLVAFATAPDVLYSANKVSSRSLQGVTADIAKCGSGCAPADVTLSVGADPRIITLLGADAATNAWVAAVGAAAGPPGLSYASAPVPGAPSPPVVNTTPPVVVVAPPVAYVADIAGTAIGAQPVNMRYIIGGSSSAINVQTDATAPGGKSLRFVDSATTTNRWEPYAWAILNHTKAVSTVEFTLRIDAASNFFHEWRDDANAYLTGPSLRVKPTGVEVAGKVVAPAPLGQWIRIKITAPLDSAAGTWSLEVRQADGGVTTVNNLPNKNSTWKRLNWLGFVSDSATASTASIGLITATNSGP